MIENIKLMLGINDDSQDAKIMLYLSKVETEVVAYCNITEITPNLISFIENKVVKILDPNSKIKSISRGDTNISYNNDSEYSISLTDSDKNYLKPFRRCRTW